MKKVLDCVQKIQTAVGGIFLTIFLITVIIQMFTRYMGISVLWTEEVAMYSFIWSVFVGASVMVRTKEHFAFTALVDNIKNENGKRILDIIISALMIGFNVAMCYYGILITEKFWNYTWVSLPQIKRGPTWICLPICAVLSTIYLIEIISNDVRDIRQTKGGAK